MCPASHPPEDAEASFPKLCSNRRRRLPFAAPLAPADQAQRNHTLHGVRRLAAIQPTLYSKHERAPSQRPIARPDTWPMEGPSHFLSLSAHRRGATVVALEASIAGHDV